MLVDIAKSHLTAGPGKNHDALFSMARDLLAVYQIGGIDRDSDEAEEMKWVLFELWYGRNKYFRTGEGEQDYWFQFMDIVKATKVPTGKGLLDVAWENVATTADLRPCDYFPDAHLRKACLFCREIQKLNGDKNFFLSVRDLAERQNVSIRTAARRLKYFSDLQLIDLKSKGDLSNRKNASQYQFNFEWDGTISSKGPEPLRVSGLGEGKEILVDPASIVIPF